MKQQWIFFFINFFIFLHFTTTDKIKPLRYDFQSLTKKKQKCINCSGITAIKKQTNIFLLFSKDQKNNWKMRK